MRKHLEKVKRWHKKFMGLGKAQRVDSDDTGEWRWLTWLKTQDARSYVRARASAKAAAVDFKQIKNHKPSEKIALASFGNRSRGDFNLWSDDDEQASDSSPSTTSNASRLPPRASNASPPPLSSSDNASRRTRAPNARSSSHASNSSISSRTSVEALHLTPRITRQRYCSYLHHTASCTTYHI